MYDVGEIISLVLTMSVCHKLGSYNSKSNNNVCKQLTHTHTLSLSLQLMVDGMSVLMAASCDCGNTRHAVNG